MPAAPGATASAPSCWATRTAALGGASVRTYVSCGLLVTGGDRQQAHHHAHTHRRNTATTGEDVVKALKEEAEDDESGLQ